jgi:hypothetical protein
MEGPVQIRVRGHGAAAKGAGSDLRTTVTFRDDSLPLPLSIHFVRLDDDETGEPELRNVGVELGEELRDQKSAEAAPELTAVALRRVVERYPHWVELARAYATFNLDEPLIDPTHRPKPARLDSEWYRMIASEYRHHCDDGDPAPITTIARSHGVTPSAASRWVKTAKEQGLIDD